MKQWAVLNNRETPKIFYRCTGCDYRKTLNDVSDRLPRTCPGCKESMEVRAYPFYTHKLAKEVSKDVMEGKNKTD